MHIGLRFNLFIDSFTCHTTYKHKIHIYINLVMLLGQTWPIRHALNYYKKLHNVTNNVYTSKTSYIKSFI